MKTIAIITEYNPMHLGHLYQIQYVKETFGDDCRIILLMSGNFVQRGEPALYSKYERAEDAIKSGASMVIELPVVFASSSAREFANAAVKLISSLGVVDTIVAGAEDSELITSHKLFDKISEILFEESPDFQELLHSNLDEGKNFAEARSIALSEILTESAILAEQKQNLNLNKYDLQNLLKKSNNILALEYAMAIKAENKIRMAKKSPLLKLNLSPRKGAAENNLKHSNEFSLSASAIRRILIETNSDAHKKSTRFLKLEKYLRSEVLARVIAPEYTQYKACVESFLARVISSTAEELTQYRDFSEDLANRIKNVCERYLFSGKNSEDKAISREEIFQEISNKYFVETRVKRASLSLLIGIRKNDWQIIKDEGPAFINVLAVDKNGRYLMKLMRKLSSLPITVKNSDLLEKLNNDLKTSKIQQQLNLNADALYKLFCQKETEGIFKEYIYIK